MKGVGKGKKERWLNQHIKVVATAQRNQKIKMKGDKETSETGKGHRNPFHIFYSFHFFSLRSAPLLKLCSSLPADLEATPWACTLAQAPGDVVLVALVILQ